MNTRVMDYRIGHWGYWRDDDRRGIDPTRIRLPVLPK